MSKLGAMEIKKGFLYFEEDVSICFYSHTNESPMTQNSSEDIWMNKKLQDFIFVLKLRTIPRVFQQHSPENQDFICETCNCRVSLWVNMPIKQMKIKLL